MSVFIIIIVIIIIINFVYVLTAWVFLCFD